MAQGNLQGTNPAACLMSSATIAGLTMSSWMMRLPQVPQGEEGVQQSLTHAVLPCFGCLWHLCVLGNRMMLSWPPRLGLLHETPELPECLQAQANVVLKVCL